MSNANLDDDGKSAILQAIYDMKTYDLEAIREAAIDQVGGLAANSTIYNADCMEVISRYERDVDESDVADYCGETTFKASDWQSAMTSYANAIANVVISAKLGEALTELEEAADEFAAEAGNYLSLPEFEVSDIMLASDCAWGLLPHSSESSNGTMYWRNLEGMRCLARRVGDIYLMARK